MNRLLPLLLPALVLLLSESCSLHGVRRSKHLVYQDAAAGVPAQELNVFAPRRGQGAPVLIFLHGGNWRSGRKELYSWFGSRLARRGIVAVIPDYPLSPDADFRQQTRYAALAFRWMQAHAAAYGGDSSRVFIAGHSSGGHLAALLGTDTAWLHGAGARGLVLIDAAGLNMDGYLRAGGLNDEPTYPATFGTDPAGWRKATPLYYVHSGMPPVLMLTGGRSYPSIISSNDTFARVLQGRGLSCRQIYQPRRAHVPMITQFFNTTNPRYGDLRRFLQSGRP